ncbi:hypothetical protein GTP81_18330 [Rugamonas sp. FT107W]|uniref:Uncharacterized protein n=1 Tax=Duganella vulcania TaxID=2692166 RepID=A0A845HIU4_9BURK|nr:hypothetical protein [Duganella vulcania]MYN18710.1 hypothetical protein [Duganella vulcania]
MLFQVSPDLKTFRPRLFVLRAFFLPLAAGIALATFSCHYQDVKIGVATMREIIVLKISDDVYVELNGAKLASTNEVAEALGKIYADNPDVTISIEADTSSHYEAIGKAIYGSHRVGFIGEQVRILVDGKLVET